jgi:hypothetical protein
MDGVRNPTVSAILGRAVGRTEFSIGANATAYLGFAGSFLPGTIDLPIAIDCCSITGGQTCKNACDYLEQNPYPNPTTLDDGVTPATKLEFDSTPEQNACWTDFGEGSGISTPELEGVVDDGNSEEFGIQDPGIQLDNGDKTPVIAQILDRMMGTGDYLGLDPEGSDRYDSPAGIDSWVVGLPVYGRPNGNGCEVSENCGGNYPVPVVGAVCFEIREINVTPEKEILGRFFCPGPSEPLGCDIVGAGSGGENFGIRATRPVLVQ